jgi:mono/diheme cytochrome c family protein
MFVKSKVRFLLCGLSLLSLCAMADDKAPVDPNSLPPVSPQKGVTYAADIQPIFADSCYPCHGPKAQKPKGKLRLDTLEAVRKGGEDGLVVIPGDSAKSVLVAQISFLGDPDDYMPPPKNKDHLKQLTKEQIGLIRAWIDQGAK